jgi:hypothetical protein
MHDKLQESILSGDRIFEKRQERFRKRFRPEERAAWTHEAAALQRAQGELVPELLDRGDDEQGPWLDLNDCGDTDLRQLVASSGPLPLDAVIGFGRQCGEILAMLHERGVRHGDIKPANFLLDAQGRLGLVDFENASWLEDGQLRHAGREGFTGGTHGFAPPEARLGVIPDESFDVFGFGATLHYLLTGACPPLRESGDFDERLLARLRPSLQDGLLTLVRSCLHKDADARPKSDELAPAFAPLQRPTRADLELELALLEGRDHGLELTGSYETRLQRRAHQAARLDAILSEIPITELDDPIEERFQVAERFLAAARITLRWVPMLPQLRERLARAQIKIPMLLSALPAEAKRAFNAGQLASASQLAKRTERFIAELGELPLERRDIAGLLTAVLRAVHSIRRHVEAEEPKQRELWQEVEESEARLDLNSARSALQELQERYSGTTPMTIAARDRLHRLIWLLERLLAGRSSIERAIELLPETRCPELIRLLDDLERTQGIERNESQQHNLDVIGRILGELLQSHPKLELGNAQRELKALRLQLSNRAIDVLDRMEERLGSDPVPIRLLTQDLEEVDRILLLGALVDTARSDRSSLLDRLERLRLRIEEIAEKGQRLIQGAKDQFDHGRLTTALYDLERALQASEQDSGAPDETQLGIREELERVRRLREEVQHATRRNRELAEMHHRLSTEGHQSIEARQRILEERCQLLEFLIEKGSRAFAPRYRNELFDARLTAAREKAEQSELQYLHETKPEAQMRIAQEMLDVLRETRSEIGEAATAPLSTIGERWRSYYERAERDEARRAAELAHELKLRARKIWITVASILAAGALALTWLALSP